MTDLTGRPFLGSRASICGDCGHFREAFSVTSESLPLLVADLLSLAIRGLDTMSGASILELRVGALE